VNNGIKKEPTKALLLYVKEVVICNQLQGIMLFSFLVVFNY